MRLARNLIIGLVLIVLALVGYVIYLSQLRPLPVSSNWDLKGYSDGIELRRKDPKYSIGADGTVGSGVIKLNHSSQIVVTREGAVTPELIDKIESVSIMMEGKIYVIRPSESSISGFRDR